MQSVSAAFTAEEKDRVRQITHNLLVSWKKQVVIGNRTFTIGVSSIGGNDVIGINPGALGGPGIYRYFDESDYVLGLAWERGLSMPKGGLSKALAEARLDNTSGRFTPRYMGGNSELFTAIEPRKPMIISAGFEHSGIEDSIPQFAGILTTQPKISVRNKEVSLRAADYIDYFENRFMDQTTMFTGLYTHEVLENLMTQLGMATSQYDLDLGINKIDFGIFEKGAIFSDLINDIVEAENGHFYQDETGVFRFENRQHWDSPPYDAVQKLVLTGQVIEAEGPAEDHIVNVVEVRSSPRSKQPYQLIFQLASPITVTAGTREEIFVDFDDPVINSDTRPIYVVYTANTQSDGTGSTITIVENAKDVFARSAKLIVTPSASGFITGIDIFGAPARVTAEIYYRAQDDSSVTAFEERKLLIENDYIQSASWANSYANMVLRDFAEPENLQRVTIRAIPELQMGDLISWQGRHWRIYDIKSTLDASVGFIQELTLLQRTIATYFRIGFSTIGGPDKIAP